MKQQNPQTIFKNPKIAKIIFNFKKTLILQKTNITKQKIFLNYFNNKLKNKDGS